ncbi:MAG: hypothetical protein CMA64_08720 [Euryarchaeota archaeon]|jgi:hypothetical protein|nr:hypothetical protein [Euryarchaeota archaeon]
MASKSLDGVLVKKANKGQSFTEDQLNDFMSCADPKTGPAYFLDRYFYIQHPVKGKLLYDPYDFQEELVESYHNNRFSINLLSRQMGKTTTAAGYLLWYAMFVPDSVILIAAHKYQGAQEIMQRIRYGYELCPDHIRAGVTNYNKGSIEFENGSRIVSQATTENTGRGMSITLLYCDEFAFVRNNIATEFWTSISPTLATGGKAIITSTPNSDEDQFWLLWTEANKTLDNFGNEQDVGVNGFHAYKVLWDQHPDRNDKWADEERGRIGIERFKREHECEPIIFDETLINPIILASLEGREPLYKQGQIRWYHKPKKGKTYVVSLDPSLGTGGDYSAIQVFELPGMKQCAEWQHNKTTVQAQVNIIKQITKYIFGITNDNNNIYYSVENNTLGEAALVSIAEVGEEQIHGYFMSEPARSGHVRRFRKGFNTTHKSKLASCAKLKELIENNKLEVHSKSLISQLKTFVASGNSYQGKPGEHDDLVMALVLALRIATFLGSYDPNIQKDMRSSEDDYIEPMPSIVI